MANPQAPPYPGFAPHVNGVGPYPQQQFPNINGQPYPQGQPYPYPGQQFPANQAYPAPGPQQYPANQAYPAPGPQQYPANQPFVAPGAQQYPPQGPYPQGANNAGFVPYAPPPVIHVPGPMAYSGDQADKIEDNMLPGWTGFTDKAIRAVFVRKVYAILMLQLLFTFAVVALFVFEPRTKLFVRRHTYLYYVSYFIFLGVYIALLCCGNVRRQYPTNMILLSIFTGCMSYMLGTISSFYDTDVVLLAVGICAGVCLAVSVFSFHTKFDFTSCGGVLFILIWVLFLMGIISIFTRNHIMSTVYAGCGALVFVLFLAYDTQMLMGGKKHEISPEEHIFAAMQIYLDIVYLFMFILMLAGGRK